MSKSVGPYMTLAPCIAPDQFVGRADEIDAIHDLLHSKTSVSEQRYVILDGISGIGKTQLAIAYARKHRDHYTSILWLDATSKSSIYASFSSIAKSLLPKDDQNVLDKEQTCARVQEWLSNILSARWLIIFDNHNHPEQYNLNSFWPPVAHGSIIITTQLPDRLKGPRIQLQPLTAMDDGLDILQVRSGRNNIRKDPGARSLINRVAGLPLALNIAGAFLCTTALSFRQYLDLYDQKWYEASHQTFDSQEDRIMYTTLCITDSHLKAKDTEAAQMLQLLAYFDHQELWYELFRAELPSSASAPERILHSLSTWLPKWAPMRTLTHLPACLASQSEFERVMRTLAEYGLVHVQHASQSDSVYSVHRCVHNWTLMMLNQEPSQRFYWYAFDCVAGSLKQQDWEILGQPSYARTSRHAVHLTHPQIAALNQNNLEDWLTKRLDEIGLIAQLLVEQEELSAARKMFDRALNGHEKKFGPHFMIDIGTVGYLGNLYYAEGKPVQAELMFARALVRHEKALGPDHHLTLTTVRHLAFVYARKNRLAEAEQLYMRALIGMEKNLGPGHSSTAIAAQMLGDLYRSQGKPTEAAQMYTRALTGFESSMGLDHDFTLLTLTKLGIIYVEQDKLTAVEGVYTRALAGWKAKSKFRLAVDIYGHLGTVYTKQGKLPEAERLLTRALYGKERMLGAEHKSTLEIVNNLGLLRVEQGRLSEAEQLYKRALVGKEKIAFDSPSTLSTVYNLGSLYGKQNKLSEAEQMFKRALKGKKQVRDREQTSIYKASHHLGRIYHVQGKLTEAEERYLQSLADYEKVFGREHDETAVVIYDLGSLYRQQGRLAEAEAMYQRVIARNKEPGEQHKLTFDAMLKLSHVYFQQGRLADAYHSLEQAVVEEEEQGLNRALEIDAPKSLFYAYQGKFEEAESRLTHIHTKGRITCPLHAKTSTVEQGSVPVSACVSRALISLLNQALRLRFDDPTIKDILLARIVQQAAEQAKSDKTILGVLTRALIHMNQDEDASTAQSYYSLSLSPPLSPSLSNTENENNTIVCDSCQSNIPTSQERWTCRQCANIDLCHDCMQSDTSNYYPQLANPIKGCHGHQFYDIGSASIETTKRILDSREVSTTVTDTDIDIDIDTRMDVWLGRLRDKHPAPAKN